MKKEEQILLAYMYDKGYTDEDMFDAKTMDAVKSSKEFRIHIFNIKYPNVVEALSNLAKRIVKAFSAIAERVKEIWPAFPEIKEYASYEPSTEFIRASNFTPIDFDKRPLIKHQVIDRKPKFITRKIIR